MKLLKITYEDVSMQTILAESEKTDFFFCYKIHLEYKNLTI